MLISAFELYFARYGLKGSFEETFGRALNTTIASSFFRVADYWTPIPDDGFVYREAVNSTIWLTSVFFLGHELGHVMLGHLGEAEKRDAVIGTASGNASVAVLRPEHRQEFEADEYALDLIFRADDAGQLTKPGSDASIYWNSTYALIGWAFSIIQAIEALGLRLNIEIRDTHPAAGERWKRIATSIRARRPVSELTVQLERQANDEALLCAKSDTLPEIRQKMGAKELVAFPYYSFMPKLIAEIRSAQSFDAQRPSIALFTQWIEVPSFDAAEELLKAHPELMSPHSFMMHYTLADMQKDERARIRILHHRLPVVQRAREIGLDAALAEWANGQLPPLAEPVLWFEVPAEQFQRFNAAEEAGDKPLMDRILATSSELVAFKKLPDTIMQLIRTTKPNETRSVLETHPELLHPMSDDLLDILTKEEPPATQARIERFRQLIHRARVVGAARAVLEAQIVWKISD